MDPVVGANGRVFGWTTPKCASDDGRQCGMGPEECVLVPLAYISKIKTSWIEGYVNIHLGIAGRDDMTFRVKVEDARATERLIAKVPMPLELVLRRKA